MPTFFSFLALFSVFVTEALVFGQRVSRVVHRLMDCKQRKLHDRQWALVMHNHQGGETGNSEIWTQRLKRLVVLLLGFFLCLELVALEFFLMSLCFCCYVCFELCLLGVGVLFCFGLFCSEICFVWICFFCFVLFGFLCAFLVCKCHCFVFCCFDTGMFFEKPEKIARGGLNGRGCKEVVEVLNLKISSYMVLLASCFLFSRWWGLENPAKWTDATQTFQGSDGNFGIWFWTKFENEWSLFFHQCPLGKNMNQVATVFMELQKGVNSQCMRQKQQSTKNPFSIFLGPLDWTFIDLTCIKRSKSWKSVTLHPRNLT